MYGCGYFDREIQEEHKQERDCFSGVVWVGEVRTGKEQAGVRRIV